MNLINNCEIMMQEKVKYLKINELNSDLGMNYN